MAAPPTSDRRVSSGAGAASGSGSSDESFLQLHSAWARPILSFIKSRVAPATAEDLASQTWLNAWKQFGTFTGNETDFRAWIFRIARNQVIDYYRRKKPDSFPEDFDPADSSDLGEDERLPVLRDCLGALRVQNPDFAQIVEQRLSDVDYSSIALELGIPEKTAMTRFHRAKLLLRECMEGKGN